MSKEIKLSEEQADQLWGEIESEGFGYWVQEYGYKEGETDPELVKLCDEAKFAMDKLREYIDAIFEHYDIG
jgi:hypothetical protein